MSKEKNKGHADPMKTRTGKTRLGPLNFRQLNELIAKESRPKVKAKIQQRIWELSQRPGYKSDATPVAAND